MPPPARGCLPRGRRGSPVYRSVILKSASAQKRSGIRIGTTETAVEIHRLVTATHFEDIATE